MSTVINLPLSLGRQHVVVLVVRILLTLERDETQKKPRPLWTANTKVAVRVVARVVARVAAKVEERENVKVGNSRLPRAHSPVPQCWISVQGPLSVS